MEQKKKGFIKKIIDDLVESTKVQHQITKERHKQAKKPPLQKQKEELARLISER